MKDGERERPIENYEKKEQKEWLDNTLPDLHPCTAGNKEEEHKYSLMFHQYQTRLPTASTTIFFCFLFVLL